MNNPKKLANKFIKKYKLLNIDYLSIKKAANEEGYTVVEFNRILNQEDVQTIIDNLGISEYILKSRGFTYVSADHRLIFINEDLNNDEKLLVLSHELGHIVCEHFSTGLIIGNDVKDEGEANEFSHYLLKKSNIIKFKTLCACNPKWVAVTVVAICIIICTITAFFVIANNRLYKDGLYVTSAGECYHKKECIFIKNKTNVQKLTKEEFEQKIYRSCDMCLPDEN